MFDYTGVKCPYCNLDIVEGQDVAVCPVCGTPHHRECYKQHGRCANEVLHSPTFEWKPPEGLKPAADSADTVFCANCGAANRAGSQFCNSCGASMSPAAPQPLAPPFLNNDAYTIDELYTKDSKIDDIPVSEWITYIGNSAPYYLYNFKSQDRLGKKRAFTWSALLFPWAYFLYRRVWNAAILSIVVSFLLGFSTAVLEVLVPNGITFGLSVGFWTTASSVSYILSIAVNLFWGVYAVWLFRKKAARQMQHLRATSATQDEYLHRLNKRSGPSRIVLVLIALYYMALFAAYSFLL